MTTPWRGLEKLIGGAAVALDWQTEFGGQFAALKSGFLQPGALATCYPCADQCGCVHDVVQDPDGTLVSVCTCEPFCCEDTVLRREEALLWQFNRARFGRELCQAWGLERREADLGLFGITQIGSFSAESLPVFLTVQWEAQGLRRVVMDLCLRHPKGFVLLAPSSRFIDGPCLEHLSRVNAGFFDLESHVELLPSGTLRTQRSAGELFSPYLRSQVAPLEQNEAGRLFALMRTLDDQGQVRKAPLARVLRLLVLDGNTQEQTAKACGCAPSLITYRVAEIERKMGMPIARLRRYATQLGQMDQLETDPRARSTYRQGLARGTGEEEGDG